MKNYVFGYGSIINLESAAKTLGRPIKDDDAFIVDLQNYVRIWRVVAPVIVHRDGEQLIHAVFLDIQNQVGKSVNGILIDLSIDELNKLDIREKHYNRIDITPHVRPPLDNSRIFAYQGKPQFFVENFADPKVLARYVDIVYQGIRHWGTDFQEKYEATTLPHHFDVIDGVYRFNDPEQNIVTGRG
jgi:hypothetical protein